MLEDNQLDAHNEILFKTILISKRFYYKAISEVIREIIISDEQMISFHLVKYL